MRSIYDPFASGHLPFPFERRSRSDPQRRWGHPEEVAPRREPVRRIPVEPRVSEPRVSEPRVPEPRVSEPRVSEPRIPVEPVSAVPRIPVERVAADPHEALRARIPIESPAAPSTSDTPRGESATTGAEILASELAELERVKERLTRESEREVQRRERDLLVSFLDVVDDLERAIASANAAGPADEALRQGVEMVHRRFLDKLAAHGVEREGEVGDTFDPSAHEAIATAPVADPALRGLVTNVVKPGYRIAGELLRPAMVVVGKG